MMPYPNHVALLVPSVKKAADYLSQFGFSIGREEEWKSEGTREIYVGREKANALLLMEPILAGPYQRAMEKRGPGLHHIAIDVPTLEPFLASLSGTGWLLHPTSIGTIQKSKTAYLSRPGFPALIEVQEREAEPKPLFIDRLTIRMDSKLNSLLRPVGLEYLVAIDSFESFHVGTKTISLIDLI